LKELSNIKITLDIVLKVTASQKPQRPRVKRVIRASSKTCPFLHSSHNNMFLLSKFLGFQVSCIASLDRFVNREDINCVTINRYMTKSFRPTTIRDHGETQTGLKIERVPPCHGTEKHNTNSHTFYSGIDNIIA